MYIIHIVPLLRCLVKAAHTMYTVHVHAHAETYTVQCINTVHTGTHVHVHVYDETNNGGVVVTGEDEGCPPSGVSSARAAISVLQHYSIPSSQQGGRGGRHTQTQCFPEMCVYMHVHVHVNIQDMHMYACNTAFFTFTYMYNVHCVSKYKCYMYYM